MFFSSIPVAVWKINILICITHDIANEMFLKKKKKLFTLSLNSELRFRESCFVFRFLKFGAINKIVSITTSLQSVLDYLALLCMVQRLHNTGNYCKIITTSWINISLCTLVTNILVQYAFVTNKHNKTLIWEIVIILLCNFLYNNHHFQFSKLFYLWTSGKKIFLFLWF